MVHIIYHNVDINCGPDPEFVTSHSLTEPGESCKFSQVLRHKLIKSNRQSQTDHCTTDEIFMILNVSLSSNIWKIAILFCRLPHKTCNYIYKWWNWSPKCWSKLKICMFSSWRANQHQKYLLYQLQLMPSSYYYQEPCFRAYEAW